VRTPLGGFVNHTDEANCYLVEKLDWDDYRVFHLYTLRPIKKGEELTLNYHLDEA
jgi:SET domain-containing protein